MIETISTAASIGLFIGVILGLTGAGGSVFAVPLLILLMGLAASDAIGIALGAVSAAALLGAWRQRQTLIRLPACFLALGGIATAPIGKAIGTQLPETVLVIGFSLLASAIAYWMWQQAQQQPDSSQHLRGQSSRGNSDQALSCKLSVTGQFELKPRCISGLFIGGAAIGLVSGLFGVGGGFLIIPLLRYLSEITMAKAVATSLAVIAAVSLSGFISHCLQTPLTDLTILSYVLSGSLLGMILSQPVGKKLAGVTLQKSVAVLLVIVIAITMTKHFMHG